MKEFRSTVIAGWLVAIIMLGVSATPAGAVGRDKQAAFPVTIHAANGTVILTHRPTRILSLSASATQMLYSIGAGSQVVGVDKYSTFPPKAPRTNFTGYETSAEDYLPERPDLVLLAFSTGQLIAQLAKLHIPTLLLAPAASLSDVYAQVDELGRATGHEAGAAQTDAGVRAAIEHAVRAAHGLGRGGSYYVEFDQTYYSATSNTFVGQVFGRFGMRSIADAAKRAAAGYPQLSAEYVLKANPRYVFLADSICCKQSTQSFAARPGFANLGAVRARRVVALNDSVVSQWGPHTLEELVHDIAATLASRARGR